MIRSIHSCNHVGKVFWLQTDSSHPGVDGDVHVRASDHGLSNLVGLTHGPLVHDGEAYPIEDGCLEIAGICRGELEDGKADTCFDKFLGLCNRGHPEPVRSASLLDMTCHLHSAVAVGISLDGHEHLAVAHEITYLGQIVVDGSEIDGGRGRC